MNNFNYFKADRVYNELFYQFPKVFIVSEKYRNMKDSTKIAYMLLKSRLDFSIKQRQIDEKGYVYFTYTTAELCKVLNCQKQKAIAIKKELEEYQLLLQIQMGFNKSLGKNNPNRLYLAELQVSEDDVYLLEKFDADNKKNTLMNEGMKIIPTPQQKKSDENIDKSEGMKIIPRQNVDKSEGMKIIPVFNNNLDTNRHLKDTVTDDLQNQLLLDGFVDLMNDSSISTFIPDRCLNLIAKFSETFEQAQATVKTIHNAKYKAEQETGNTMVYEVAQDNWDVDTKLYTTLLKAYQKQKTEKVNNLQNLIFIYVKNLFVEQIAPSINPKNSSLPSVNTANWLKK